MNGTVSVEGFTVILVKFKPNKSTSTLTWWLKKSANNYSITVTGVPLYAREECIRRVFSCRGAIESVKLQPVDEEHGRSKSHLPQFHHSIGYQMATVKFKKESSVGRALDMKYDNNYTLYDEGDVVEPVTEVWKKDLERSYQVDTIDLLSRCTNYMEIYDKRKSKEEKINRKMADEPDADGWITVTRNKFSHPPKAVKGHELKKLKKKKEKAALVHFYKNQVNDSKLQRIKELKARFEEDKKRIQQMRQQRKFKPY